MKGIIGDLNEYLLFFNFKFKMGSNSEFIKRCNADSLKKDNLSKKLKYYLSNYYNFYDSLTENARNDKEIFLLGIQCNPLIACEYYEKLPEKLRDDKEILINVLSLEYIYEKDNSKYKPYKKPNIDIIDGLALKYSSDRLKDDMEVVEKIKKGKYLEYASDRIRNNKDFILKIIDKVHIWDFIDYFGDIFKNDKDIMLKLVGYDGDFLKYANNELKDDKDIVLKAIENEGDIKLARIIGKEFKDDEKLILKLDGGFRYASSRIKNNRNIALDAVGKKGELLKIINKKFRDDKEIVIASLKNNGKSLEFASERFINDDFFIFLALENGFDNINIISDKYKTNNNFMKKAIKFNLDWIKYANNEIKDDILFIDSLFNLYGYKIIEYIPKYISINENVAIKMLELDGCYFSHLPVDLKDDFNFIKKVANKENVLNYIVNEEFLLMLVKENISLYSKIEHKISKNIDFNKKILENNGDLFNNISEFCRNNISLFNWALLNGARNPILENAGPYVRNNIDSVIKALNQNYYNSLFIGNNILNNYRVKNKIKEMGLNEDILNYNISYDKRFFIVKEFIEKIS